MLSHLALRDQERKLEIKEGKVKGNPEDPTKAANIQRLEIGVLPTPFYAFLVLFDGLFHD